MQPESDEFQEKLQRKRIKVSHGPTEGELVLDSVLLTKPQVRDLFFEMIAPFLRRRCNETLSTEPQSTNSNSEPSSGARLSLLYRASRDGLVARDFHRCCDHKPGTVTLIRAKNGWIFGGYTPLAWDGKKRGFTAVSTWTNSDTANASSNATLTTLDCDASLMSGFLFSFGLVGEVH